MKLKEFIEVTMKEVIAFRDYWMVNHEKNPEHFPLNIDEGEWFEQFLVYQSIGQPKN